uniref:ATP-binding cassette domain-containing protein n=2 Tax=Aromatoleum buckelii TaxID=200254 RepID=A0ABX1N479_9RHOO
MGCAIKLSSLGRAYGFYDHPGDRLREVLFRKHLRREHWALRGVELEIPIGETFGLVGENGAGKSTFLKLVAGTIRPSEGSVTVGGRVAALLELGAGFHPEETGRDNVLMMGALNGVAPSRMKEYYSQVIEFAELSEEALTRPVKTYSSGMFMRLAFSAATAVDPDVLVIDEALSVGDMYFQKKSLDRIMRFRDMGKTVLFCSHNLYQVRSLCSRAAWIHEGKVAAIGETEGVVTAYESYERERDALAREIAAPVVAEAASASRSSAVSPVRLVDITIETSDGINPAFVETFQPVRLIFDVESHEEGRAFHVGFSIVRNDKENIFGSSTHFVRPDRPLKGRGEHRVAVQFPRFPILSGDYLISAYVLDDTGIQVLDMAERVRPFRVLHVGREFGMVYMAHEWENAS